MTARLRLHRGSACNTLNDAAVAAVAAAAAAAAAVPADAAAADAPWPGARAAAEDALSADAAWAAAWGSAAPPAAAAAASHGAPANSVRAGAPSIALKDAVRHRLTRPGGPRFVCGAICVVRGLRIAAGRQSTRSSDADSAGAAAHVITIFLQSGDHGIQWRL
jgi:hypothetical protein